MSVPMAWMLLLGVLLVGVAADPIPQSRLPLAAASELSSRLAAHSQHVQAIQDPKLSIPTVQDVEAIKKVAQILITLGQQVIPSIVGEPAPMANCDTPEDPVSEDNP